MLYSDQEQRGDYLFKLNRIRKSIKKNINRQMRSEIKQVLF